MLQHSQQRFWNWTTCVGYCSYQWKGTLDYMDHVLFFTIFFSQFMVFSLFCFTLSKHPQTSTIRWLLVCAHCVCVWNISDSQVPSPWMWLHELSSALRWTHNWTLTTPLWSTQVKPSQTSASLTQSSFFQVSMSAWFHMLGDIVLVCMGDAKFLLDSVYVSSLNTVLVVK